MTAPAEPHPIIPLMEAHFLYAIITPPIITAGRITTLVDINSKSFTLSISFVVRVISEETENLLKSL